MKKLIVGALAAISALGVVGIRVASADPGEECKTEWNLMFNVPICVRTTGLLPDGSYHMCTSLGTDGKGPGTCWDYSAPPRMSGSTHIQPMLLGAGMPPAPPPASRTRRTR